MICFYYGITALACVWYFRREWFTSVGNALTTFLFPLIGGLVLLVMFCVTALDSTDPDYGSGSSVFGVGTVFILGMGVLAIGVVLMMWTRLRHPAYFRGETLPQTDSTRPIPIIRPDATALPWSGTRTRGPTHEHPHRLSRAGPQHLSLIHI